jgi:two-component system sensor histidine kinase KdpD
VQAGALAVTTAPVHVEDVILAAIDELGLGPADVELGITDDPPEVLADDGLLGRVIVNLLENARKFSKPGMTVRISASTFGGAVEVRVTDNGPGVPRDRREDIFVPFQRLGDTDNATGLGLGLALSKGFVEGMGGTLQADDTPGGGLTMVISLPVTQESIQA